MFGSAPPKRAATVISLMSRVNTLPLLASTAAFLWRMLAHFECPDMTLLEIDEETYNFSIGAAPETAHFRTEATHDSAHPRRQVRKNRTGPPARARQPSRADHRCHRNGQDGQLADHGAGLFRDRRAGIKSAARTIGSQVGRE